MSPYRIVARHCPRREGDAYPWQLWNDNSGAPCGSRLYKGERKKPAVSFPLKVNPETIENSWDCGWTRYADEFEAADAADALQRYLDDYEDPALAKARIAETKAAESARQEALF